MKYYQNKCYSCSLRITDITDIISLQNISVSNPEIEIITNSIYIEMLRYFSLIFTSVFSSIFGSIFGLICLPLTCISLSVHIFNNYRTCRKYKRENIECEKIPKIQYTTNKLIEKMIQFNEV